MSLYTELGAWCPMRSRLTRPLCGFIFGAPSCAPHQWGHKKKVHISTRMLVMRIGTGNHPLNVGRAVISGDLIFVLGGSSPDLACVGVELPSCTSGNLFFRVRIECVAVSSHVEGHTMKTSVGGFQSHSGVFLTLFFLARQVIKVCLHMFENV